MKFAIIAAGEGSRLTAEGISAPKPLVEVGGEMLVDRLIRIFAENGAEEVVVICNEQRTEVREHLERLQTERKEQYDAEGNVQRKSAECDIRIVQKTTPSSMHSFYEISRWLGDAPFVLTTVDTIFREEEFADYISAFRTAVDEGDDGMMGVTDYVDDESPLYVDTDESLMITAFLDSSDDCRFISGGIYGLTPRAITILNQCIERGESRMRNFQRALVGGGLRLRAYPFSKVLDIDHASDITKAEAFITNH